MQSLINPVWNRLQKPELNFTNVLSERIWAMEERRPGNFPKFDLQQPLLIFSDYGGHHSSSRFDSYAFFITQPSELTSWENDRKSIREEYGFMDCRMSYHRLGAKDRQRVLWPWLDAADNLRGLLVTILVEKSFGSFFARTDLTRLRTEVPGYTSMKIKVIEKLFRTCHLLSLFVAGLSDARQEIIWITDEDVIAANPIRLHLLKETFLQVSTMYLGSTPQRFHCCTTADDNGSLQIEDLTSLPDLVAGALADTQTQLLIHNSPPTDHSQVLIPSSTARKSVDLLKWFSLPERALHRKVFALWLDGLGRTYANCIVFTARSQK